MKQYIGTKLVQAEFAYSEPSGENNLCIPGYRVIDPDGHESWSSKNAFEKTHLLLDVNPNLKTDAPSISQQMVDEFIASHETMTIGGKCTVVRAVLRNGFAIVESSECVSAENYDEKMGEEICMEHIKNKVWMLLGFLLATAVGGVK